MKRRTFFPGQQMRSLVLLLSVIGVGAGHDAAHAQNFLYNRNGQMVTIQSPAATAPTIVAHPASATVELGQPLSLAVQATGTGPLTYVWKKGTETISGNNAPTLFFPEFTANNAGSYTVTVSNGTGNATSNAAVLSLPVDPVASVLGVPGIWTRGGTTLMRASTDPQDTRNGGTGLTTGRVYTDKSYVQGVLTVTQPSTLRFWVILGDGTAAGAFGLTINKVLKKYENKYLWNGWTEQVVHLPPGTHTLRFEHSAGVYGRMAIDDMTLTTAADTDLDGMSDEWEREYFSNSLAQLATGDPDGDGNNNITEYYDITNPNLYGDHYTHLYTTIHGSGQVLRSVPEPTGGYRNHVGPVVVTAVPDPGYVFAGWGNAMSSNFHTQDLPFNYYISWNLSAYFDLAVTLGDAADAPGLTWTTGGDAPWVGQRRTNADGTDALMSGSVDQTMTPATGWVQTTVTGPAKLTFDLKYSRSSSASVYDFGPLVKLDGLDIGATVTENWQTYEVYIPPGSHTVRWENRQPESQSGSRYMISYLDKVSVTATTDTDSDGMADEWEQLYFGSLARNGSGDYDDDGVSDLTEYQDYTTPNNNYSKRYRVTVTTTGSGTVTKTPDLPSYLYGTMVRIIATPAVGWVFHSWENMHYTSNDLYFSGENVHALKAVFVPATTLNEALDNNELTFTSTYPSWNKSFTGSHDGVDVAELPGYSGTITTTIVGPQVLSFWWRSDVSSAVNTPLRFSVDGNVTHSVPGRSFWQRVFVNIPAGSHEVQWMGSTYNNSLFLDRVKNGVDTDTDGLPDAWETTYFGNLAATTGSIDSDNDNNSNQVEWADETHPTQAASAIYRLTVNRGELASVAINPDKLGYNPGEQVTLTAHSGLINWSGDATGTTNPLVVTMNASKTITANFSEFGLGVDNTQLAFTTGGAAPWVHEQNFGYDSVGEDAAKSGNLTTGQECWAEVTVTGGGLLSFDYLPNYNTNYATSVFAWTVNGVEAGRFTSTPSSYSAPNAYVKEGIIIPNGTHTIRWKYTKGDNSYEAVYMDNLVWTPMPYISAETALDTTGLTWNVGTPVPKWLGQSTVTHDGVDALQSTPIPEGGTTFVETTVNLAAQNVLNFWWKTSSRLGEHYFKLYVDGVSVKQLSGDSGWQNVGLLLSAGAHTLRWSYEKNTVYKDFEDLVWLDQVSIAPVQSSTLPVALDNSLTWTTSTIPWTGSNLMTHDGVDAAGSGAVAVNQESWLQTTVTGPGTISFWWKVSTAAFGTDVGYSVQNISSGFNVSSVFASNELDWTFVQVQVPAGSYRVRFTYDKWLNVSNLGSDKMWVDEFSFTTGGPSLSSWATSQGLSGPNAQANATPQNDGITNLQKYAFNLPGNAAVQGAARTLTPGTGVSGLPSIQSTGAGASRRLRVEFVRRRNVSGLTCRAQFGSTLVDFANGAGTETVTTINADWERVVIEDTVNQGTSTRRFGRVYIVAP